MSGKLVALTLAGVAAMQALYLVRPDRAPEARAVVPPLGEAVSDTLIASATGETRVLSDIAPGQCRYVVLYSTRCGPSMALARQWTQDLEAVPGSRAVPAGWEALWIAVEDSSGVEFPAAAVVGHYRSKRPTALARALGVTAYPAHIILDRAGRVVAGDVGAPLRALEAYQADCTIRRPVNGALER